MSTNEDSGVDTNDFIGHDAAGKHLLLLVPDYEDSGVGTRYQVRKNTYLNLGRGVGNADQSLPAWYPSNWTAEGLDATVYSAPQNSGDDLLASFEGFTDDTRMRGTGTAAGGSFGATGATPPNETTARTAAAYSGASAAPGSPASQNAAVTQTIPDYLGWRDHTDGHRITTTRGDKIEIIGGNYKLVSLGRATGTAVFEMSGGLITGGDEAPGSVTSVSWVVCPTGATGEQGWRVTEQTVKGNTVERFHGTKREESYGNEFISVTGAPSSRRSTSVDVCKSDGASATITELTFDTHSNFPDGGALPTQWDQEDSAPTLQKPTIRESTWAQKVVSFTDVEEDVVERAVYRRRKDVQEEFTSDGYLSEITLHTVGKRFSEWWYLAGSEGFYEYFQGAKSEFFLGASTTLGLANRFECFVGTEEQINLGLALSLAIALKADITLAAAMEINIGPKLESNTLKWEIDWQRNYAVAQSTAAAVAQASTALTTQQTALVNNSSAALTNVGP
jgi:hypothetical protein